MRSLFFVILLCFTFPNSVYTAEDDSAFLKDRVVLTEYVKQNAVPINWNDLLSGGEKVTYIGEIHPSPEIRQELIRQMKALKTVGITHLAMEMLSEDYKAAAKQYCCNGKCEDQLKESFEKFGWSSSHYMEVAAAAKAVGIQLVAIDLSFDIREKVNESRLKLKYSTKEGDFDEYCRIGDRLFQLRDETMAKNLAAVLKDQPSARIIAFTGARHAVSDAQPRILLEKYGVASKSYRTVAHEFPLIKVLNETNRRDESLYLPVPAELGFNGYINVPIETQDRRAETPTALSHR